MASKRHLRRKACENKRSYPTMDDAISASIGLRKRTGDRTSAFQVLDQIRPWLLEHGPATAREIAEGLGIAEPSQVNHQIRKGRVRGAVVAGKRLVGNRYFIVCEIEE